MEERYHFGKNWESYSHGVDEESIAYSVEAIGNFISEKEIEGKRVLDIGSGSGLSSLAFLQMGAAEVVAFDYDKDSVETTRKILSSFAGDKKWNCFQADILSPPADLGEFDIVYSWGVLHHTGSMYQAIKNAARFVKPGGYFFIALYSKTPLCWFWKGEKYLYCKMGNTCRAVIKWLYKKLFRLRMFFSSREIREKYGNKKKDRGMNFDHDADDWLGGYPYESATAEQIVSFVVPQGFEELKVKSVTSFGMFGSGCSEYLFKKQI